MIHDHDFDAEEEELTPRQRLLVQIIAAMLVFGLTVLARRLFGAGW